MIELKDVYKVFPPRGGVGDPVVAVDGVSLSVGAGETLCLIGTSGCGKTTTMKMINRLIEPTRGAITVGGEDVAAQDVIRNLFGGMTIFLDRPFQVGERVIFEGYDGVVEEIGFRSTKLRTPDGHLVTVPNGAITNHCVENIGRRPSIRRDFQVGVTYDTPPEKLKAGIEAIRGILEESEIRQQIHPRVDGDEFPPRVFFQEFADSALVIRVLYWFSSPDYWAYVEHAERVNLRILEKFNEMGIEFAFPTQTVHLAKDAESDEP